MNKILKSFLTMSLMFGLSAPVMAAPDINLNITNNPYYEPIQMTDSQSVSNNSITETKNKIAVTASFIISQPETRVVDPDSSGKVIAYINPYSYNNVINTVLIKISVKNESSKPIELRGRKYELLLDNSPDKAKSIFSESVPSLDFIELAKLWRGYYYFNTYPPAGDALHFEQEKAIEAENYIVRTALKGGTVQPSGSMEGFIAFPVKNLTSANLLLQVNDIYVDNQLVNFKFQFHSIKK